MAFDKAVAPTTVLVVDDYGSVRTLIRKLLEHRGIVVYEAPSGQEAIRLFRAHRDEFSLILLDVQMQRMDGPETLDALREIDPGVRCCFLTGDSGGYSEDELLRRGAVRVLYKPFILADVLELLIGDSTGTLHHLPGRTPT